MLSTRGEEPRSSARWLVTIAVLFCLLFVDGTRAQQTVGPKFTTFEIPGAGTGAHEGTLARTIRNVTSRLPASVKNPQYPGVIAGTYIDANHVYHGFYRLENGQVVTFDISGAPGTPDFGTGGYGPLDIFPIRPNDFWGLYLNSRGDIVGTYADSKNVFHGFQRYAPEFPNRFAGYFPVEVGAGTGINQGTVALGIDSERNITGTFIDSRDVYNAFYRYANGVTIKTNFGGVGRHQGTVPLRIVQKECVPEDIPRYPCSVMAGYFIDGGNVYHAFVWTSGAFDTDKIDAPGAGAGPGLGTLIVAVVPAAGTAFKVTGYYIDARAVTHGFEWHGNSTTFDVPGAGTLPGTGQGTVPVDLRDTGAFTSEITGYYVDAHFVTHGFVRDPGGKITTFDAPGACSDPFNALCKGKGTEPTGIDGSGRITGYFLDASSVFHGFVRTP